MTRCLIAAAVALLVAVPSAAQMADTISTEGWTFGASAGGGVGSFQFHCPTIAGVRTNCYDERETGGSAYVRGGVFPRHDLFAGLEVIGWRKDVQGVDNTALFVSLVAQWYPPRTGGLYVRAGAGAALTWATDGEDEVTTDGAAWSAGVGYDVPISHRLALTPFVTYLRSLEADIELNGLTTQRFISHDLLQLGLGLTWH